MFINYTFSKSEKKEKRQHIKRARLIQIYVPRKRYIQKNYVYRVFFLYQSAAQIRIYLAPPPKLVVLFNRNQLVNAETILKSIYLKQEVDSIIPAIQPCITLLVVGVISFIFVNLNERNKKMKIRTHNAARGKLPRGGLQTGLFLQTKIYTVPVRSHILMSILDKR